MAPLYLFDIRRDQKEEKKAINYDLLRSVLASFWKLKKVTIILVVIDPLCPMPEWIKTWIKNGIDCLVKLLRKGRHLEPVRIIRKAMNSKESEENCMRYQAVSLLNKKLSNCIETAFGHIGRWKSNKEKFDRFSQL